MYTTGVRPSQDLNRWIFEISPHRDDAEHEHRPKALLQQAEIFQKASTYEAVYGRSVIPRQAMRNPDSRRLAGRCGLAGCKKHDGAERVMQYRCQMG